MRWGQRRHLARFLAGFTLFFWVGTALGQPGPPDFDQAALLLSRGMVLEAMGVYQEIADTASNAHFRSLALFLMGNTCSAYLNRPEEALSRFHEVLTRFPTSLAAQDALFQIGVVLYGQQKFGEARDAFNRYLTRYPEGFRRASAKSWAQASRRLMASSSRLAPPYAGISADTTVRVLLCEKVATVRIGGPGPIVVSDVQTGTPVFSGAAPVVIGFRGVDLSCNGAMLRTSSCRISGQGHVIQVSDRRFRGDLVVSCTPEGLTVVNRLGLEAYLYGVVPGEMPRTWNRAALMAQAVAARTYVLYLKSKRMDMPYDVEATASFQVYEGLDAESAATNQAVDATRGQVMVYDGLPILAYFHSDSGGYTEDAKNVWSTDIPYLKGIPDRFSSDSPEASWNYFLSYKALGNILRQNGYAVGAIRALRSDRVSCSGRPGKVMLVTDRGVSEMTSNNFRIRVGRKLIRSTLFQMTPERDGALFHGKGYGHGVGMSQWGALRMAQAGYSYRDILHHYYQGVQLVSLKR
jgi:stage II sporulation protein D